MQYHIRSGVRSLVGPAGEVVRRLIGQAIEEAKADGGEPGKIAEAEQALTNGNAKRAAGQFKDTVADYKDAVAKAEGA